MEPIINPWLFYFMSVVDGFCICVCIFAVTILVYLAATGITATIDEDLRRYFTKYLKPSLIALAVSTLILIFVPSKQTMIEMIIASHATPDNINMVIETIIENAARVAEVF